MQQIVCATLVGVLLTAGTGCFQSTKEAKTGDSIEEKTKRPVPPSEPPYPKAVVDKPVHDFGVMEAETLGKYSFIIRNEGDFPLELVKGSTTCKCTLNKLSDRSLKKGESTTIDLEWKPPGEAPVFEQSAEIWTNDPKQPSIQLIVRGRVEKIVELVPRGQWAVGIIEGENEKVVDGFVKSALLDKFEVHGIHSTTDDIAVVRRPMTKEELTEHKAKSGYRITAKLKNNNVIGRFSKRLTIKTSVNQSKDREGESYVVDVVGTRTGPILIRSEPGVRWDNAGMQMTIIKPFRSMEGTSASVLLFVAGLKKSDELTIAKVSSDPDSIRVKLEPLPAPELETGSTPGTTRQRPRKSYRLVFEFPSGMRSETRTRKHPAIVKISTSHPGVKEMTFSLIYRAY